MTTITTDQYFDAVMALETSLRRGTGTTTQSPYSPEYTALKNQLDAVYLGGAAISPRLAQVTGLRVAKPQAPAVSPTAVADAARHDPSYRQNVTNSIMAGVNPAVAEVRALVAYATVNNLSGFLTHEELSLLPKDEFNAVWSRFGADVIRDPLFAELSPFEQLTSDPERYMELHPDAPDAKAFAEAREWDSMSDDEKVAQRDGKTLLAKLQTQFAEDTQRERGRRTGITPMDVKARLMNSSAPELVRKAATRLLDKQAADTAAARAANAARYGEE